MQEVFVTGASGFLGAHLVRELLDAGVSVKALSRRPETDATLRAIGAEPVRAELADRASLTTALAGCEAVFHAAADTSMWRPTATAQTATNVTGTENLLAAAKAGSVGAIIHTSSVSAYSHKVSGTVSEMTPQQGGDSWINYERTKFLGEQIVRQGDVPWIVFNPSHILGPGDRHNWARLIMLVDREKLPGIPPGSGAFADVREIAKAQVKAWRAQRFGQRYLVGGQHASFVELVHHVGSTLGRRTPRRATPPLALQGYARVLDLWSRVSGREPDVTPESATLTCHHLQVDSSKAIAELGFRETPLDLLLSDTLAWMRSEGMVGK
jgi:dihydroflavonol-4-reductase